MKRRGNWQGMLTIVRFNLPFYLAAAVIAVVSVGGLWIADPLWLKWLCLAALAGTAWFLIGSLGVSHRVYDRSDLYRWRWLDRALHGSAKESFALCHSGFDEVSEPLQERFPGSRWSVLDHYDPERMTEPSIRRARRLHPPREGTLATPFDRWPVPGSSVDAVFGLLAIHELRGDAERSAWFREARRCLKPRGRIILAEHVRDAANFLAFGPGFLHFHSCRSWRRSWKTAGLRATDAFRITPWVRVFVLVPHE